MDPRPVRIEPRGTGVQQRVTGERIQAASLRFEGVLARARQEDAHVWIAVVGHHLSDELAVRLARIPSTEPDLDAESIITASVGCYRCEQELSARIVVRPCPGDAPQPT